MTLSKSIEATLRTPLLDDERIMAAWDSWREYIADGGTGSWPRDQFEMLLSSLDGEREDAADEIARLTRRVVELEAR
jgi:hypothetical protein